jgi:hypothetical protein
MSSRAVGGGIEWYDSHAIMLNSDALSQGRGSFEGRRIAKSSRTRYFRSGSGGMLRGRPSV